MNTIIPSIFCILCTTFMLQHIIPSTTLQNRNKKVLFAFTIILFFCTYITRAYFIPLFSFMYTLELCIFLKIVYKLKLDFSLICAFLSYSIYHSLFAINSLLITIILIPIYYGSYLEANTLSIIFSGALTYISILLLFRIKRFKNGMSFLTNSKVINIGLIISFLILALKAIDQIYYQNNAYSIHVYFSALIPLITFLLAILLFAWWRRMITKSYIEKIRKLERQSLYDELAENAATIQKLREDNQALARILHKDNKLIPAMENAVTEFLLCRTSAELSEAKIYGEKLVAELQFMFQDRKGIMDDYDSQNVCLTQTGTVAVDAMLAYMQKKAASKQVVFTCKHTPTAMEHLLTRISPEDLSHLLSDLLENALNAMSDTNGGKLQVVLGKLEKDAYISVADTGTSFDIETLQLLGIQQHTTHADTGGSGIGLMDIWKLKKKYRASIQIQEFESQQNAYTKKITLFFNNKNHYVIQSYRHKEIINTQTRGDLYVIPAETIQVTEEFTHE